MIVHRLGSIHAPSNTDVVITGPDLYPIHIGSGRLQESPLHHEADVLIAFHVINETSLGQRNIRVACDDTDVLGILAHHLYVYMQTKGLSHISLSIKSCTSRHSIISVNDVVNKYATILPSLLTAHVLTGCDTVSSFAGKGNTTVFKKLEVYTGYLKLGNVSVPLQEIFKSYFQFTSLLYWEETETDLNKVLTNVFQKKISEKRHIPHKLTSLPSTMASFQGHVKRAHFQAVVWKSGGKSSPPALSPIDKGWVMRQSTLHPSLGFDDEMPAPDEVRNLINY